MLSLVNLNTRLRLGLLLALIEDVLGTLPFYYFAVHHQIVKQFLIQ